MGYNNLNQLLAAYQIKSNNYYKLFNKLSLCDLSKLSIHLFKQNLIEKLIELGKKSDSTWSRFSPTIIIDASIFKIWLKEQGFVLYDKFFSGQTGKGEHGYKLTLAGIAISDTFYPLQFIIASKKITDAEIAQLLLESTHQFIESIENEHELNFVKWYLSVDSGYSDSDLIALASRLKIDMICVPNKTHLFMINGIKTNMKKYIKEIFLPDEKEYYLENNKDTAEPFTMRIKANYKSKGIDVVLLLFRLKDSKKVSVVYCIDLNIKQKTLRHRWFQRTYIEQYFRFCKHTLQIAASTYSDEYDFVRKIYLFFLKANFALQVRNDCRKRKGFKKITFGTIRLLVSKNNLIDDWIIKLLNLERPFD